MNLRRCQILLIEPHEALSFDLADLLAGGAGLLAERSWRALAPHLQQPVELDAAAVELLGRLPVQAWTAAEQLRAEHDPVLLERLLALGLLLSDAEPLSAAAIADARLRAVGWHPLSAVAHVFGRWRDIDSLARQQEGALGSRSELLARLGPAPPACIDRGDPARAVELPVEAASDFDRLLRQRVTCRNFDSARALPLALLASMLQRGFGALAVLEPMPGHRVLKKASPSAGGLHPCEAQLLVQNVDGLAPGLYHYRPVEHRLQPMPAPAERELTQLASVGLAGQSYFANAPVLLIISARFERNYWKYREHSKSYRAIALDLGHLSQTLYLSASELGLGAFVTAAINELPLEAALGLDGLAEGVLAMAGFGYRALQRSEPELDPLGQIWIAAAGMR